jgi:DNA-binding transcriptional MerR regulator
MEGLTISKVAEQTGFSPSALRFYDAAGLVTPARTPAGYRSYDAACIEVLQFIARAKRLGLSLDDISDLLTLLDDQRCQPVQERLRGLLTAKIADAHDQVANLLAFTAQLQHAAARLSTHTPDGPCDRDCGCTADPAGDVARSPVELSAEPTRPDDVPIACTLGAREMHVRVADWQEALRQATEREPIAGGVRIRFPRHTPIERLATLIEAEQACCRFFSFSLTVATDHVALDVTGPQGTEEITHALAGSAGLLPDRLQHPAVP